MCEHTISVIMKCEIAISAAAVWFFQHPIHSNCVCIIYHPWVIFAQTFQFSAWLRYNILNIGIEKIAMLNLNWKTSSSSVFLLQWKLTWTIFKRPFMLNLTAASGLFQWVVNAAQSAWDVRYGTGLSGGGGGWRAGNIACHSLNKLHLFCLLWAIFCCNNSSCLILLHQLKFSIVLIEELLLGFVAAFSTHLLTFSWNKIKFLKYYPEAYGNLIGVILSQNDQETWSLFSVEPYA